MKTILSLLLFFALSYTVNAQTDDVWGVNTDNELIKFQVNTSGFTLATSNEIGSDVLGRSSAACGIAGNYIYYIPYGDGAEGEGEGELDIRSVTKTGTGDGRKVNNFDMNGSSDDDLAFVRLGFDNNGVGWIVAKGSNNAFHVAKFMVDGSGGVSGNTNTNNATGPSRVGTFTITNGSNLGSGDLAFDTNGSMYLLVNTNSGTNVSIYVISAATLATHTGSSSNTNLAAPKWTLKSPSGGDFSAIVNGIAFASDGSLYLSDAGALYYVDATTVNNPAPGNVLVKKIADTGGNSVADLATDIFPITNLPVEYGAISAQRTNNQLKVSWQTLQENGVKDYVIEASVDGENWTAIGKLDSKAPGGSSDQAINYEFAIDVSAMAIAGWGLAFLLLPLFRSRAAKAVLVLAVLVGVLVSCSKNDDALDVSKVENLWVRIVQHDIDGGSSVTKVIKAVDR